MPIMLDGSQAYRVDARSRGGFSAHPRDREQVRAPCIEIGLVNNMPDAAVVAAEQQFMELLTAAAGRTPVRLHFFTLPDLVRGPALADHMRANYADVAQLGAVPLDALIVTGNEPRAASLDEEPYWKSLTQVIDWAEDNTASTIFSCLAAHAAVLHLDGVQRRRSATKCTGVYRCLPVADHPLLKGLGPHIAVPHSRWNDLAEDDLVAQGYTVLTRARGAGVDMFAKQWKSLFVFFQGHPEYHVDSLLREYRRDVLRALRGEGAYPTLPLGYFTRPSETELAELARRPSHNTLADGTADLARVMRIRPSLVRHWRASVVPVVENWLRYLTVRKGCEVA